ncbi:MAG TPA: hypothetical protein VHL11_12765, partial [Phototrophicaceae bacterium]|nr:hypothetical protein [Phototrophicaceae bacterium]
MQELITYSSTLLVWCVLFAAITGAGLLIQYLFRQRTGTMTATLSVSVDTMSVDTTFNAFWIGFALSIAVLQFWHLFLPIQA